MIFTSVLSRGPASSTARDVRRPTSVHLMTSIERTFLHVVGCFVGSIAVVVGVTPAAAAGKSGYVMSVVQYASDPPASVREAPGGGRVLSPAVVYTPAAGDNPFGPAIIMLDQGPGSHPLEQGQASRFAAEKLAALGYTVMSLYDGQERGFALEPFTETQYAVKGAIDYLEVMGHEKFVIVGQGYGAIVAANYLANQPDVLLDNGGEKRVKAVVLLDPLTELQRYPRLRFDGGYDAVMAKAKASVASGRGGYPKTLEPGHGAGDQYDPWILPGPFLGPAVAILDYWGPDATTRNADLLAKLAVPAYIIAGDHDDTVDLDKLRALKTASTVDLQTLTGGDAHFTGLESQVTDDIVKWLKAHDLGTRPRVDTRTLDVTADDGRILQGVLYTPAGSDAKDKPIVVLVSGRTADTIQASTQWMGWRIAQQGYAVLAPGMRISGVAGVQEQTLASAASDLGHWNDKVASMGYRRIVMGGHSNGGIWLSNYLSLSHDKRVVGTIYFAPTRDEPTYTRFLDGDVAFDKKIEDAQAAVAAGKGATTPIGLLSAQSFLDFTGPDSRAVHTARVKEFALPGLVITGGKDPLMAPDFVARFQRDYRGPLTMIRYDNGSHGLRENKNNVGVDVGAWLAKTYH